MIITAFLTVLSTLLSFIVGIFTQFPDVSLGSSMASAIATASGYYAALNAIFPVGTLLAIAAFDISFELSYFTYKMVRWAYTKIPGVN